MGPSPWRLSPRSPPPSGPGWAHEARGRHNARPGGEELRYKGWRYRWDKIGGSGEEPPDPPPTDEQLDELIRQARCHLADVELVGPEKVEEVARSLFDTAARLRWLQATPSDVDEASVPFRNEAKAALDLPG